MVTIGSESTLHGSYTYTENDSVFYGAGCTSTALPKLLDKYSVKKKVLIVSGKSIYSKTDLIKRTESILSSHGISSTVFYSIGEHTPVADINAGIKVLKVFGADAIVSVGGGSAVDASKAMIYRLHEENGGWLRQVAIPTTLSAAEYTVTAGYTNEEGQKVAVAAPELAPVGIILDAEYTLHTPERLWLSTGIRALDHAVENLYRPFIPLPLKHLCYPAIADLFTCLPLSKSTPSDIAVRQKLQLASWMSIWPWRIEVYGALGLSHSLGHKLGARYGIGHGITSCLTLAPTVALQARFASEEDKQWLAQALFHLRQPSTGSVEGDIVKLSQSIAALVESLGLKSTLTEYDVPRADLEGIAESAMVGGRQDEVQFREVIKLLEGLY